MRLLNFSLNLFLHFLLLRFFATDIEEAVGEGSAGFGGFLPGKGLLGDDVVAEAVYNIIGNVFFIAIAGEVDVGTRGWYAAIGNPFYIAIF